VGGREDNVALLSTSDLKLQGVCRLFVLIPCMMWCKNLYLLCAVNQELNG
jgi:hypothetical protein